MNKIFFKSSRSLITFSVLLSTFSISSCKKLVETPPPTSSISEANVFSIDATAIAAVNNIYINMNHAGYPIQGANSFSLYAGLSADELTSYVTAGPANYVLLYKNATTAISGAGSTLWAPLYNLIFKCNAAIEALSSLKSEGLTPVIKMQLLGEAHFLRGYFYFNLVNLFGDVPLCVSTDPQVNTLLPRSSRAIVYQQIIADLLAAKQNLGDKFLAGDLVTISTERVRPTKWAATALLARAYLYNVEYAKAEEQANLVINNTALFGPLPALNNAFLKNSKEAIWQIQPTEINFNTPEARTFILTSPANGPSANNPVYLSNNLIGSFEANDLRAKPKNWVDTIRVSGIKYYFPYKYKINSSTGVTSASGMSEYFMMLRLAEQYLIRAEAKAKQNNLSGAIADLDQIRNRAGLPLIANTNPGIGQSALLDKILDERRHELFTEGANRWFELKRTGKVDEVMTIATPLKSNNTIQWQSFQQLYPIPVTELQKAPNLTQNTGY